MWNSANALVAAVMVLVAGSAAAQDSSDLVVHEWGTFTSLQGSDGVGLAGLQYEEELLPSFVYSRTEVRDCPLREFGYKGLEVPVSGVTQKMETPVLYFHTSQPQRLRVRVDFVGGLLTQWYPVSDLLGPPELTPQEGPLDLGQVERSFLEWDIELIPHSRPAPSGIPSVASDDPWSFARDVDAAYVRTMPRASDRMGPVEAEHYLFYRGLGTFSLPVSVAAATGGRATFKLGESQPLAAAFALEIGEAGGRYLPMGEVERGEHGIDLGALPFGEADLVVARLGKEIQAALVAQGLFADEALAMVRTWSRQWFTTRGNRIIYLVPEALTNELLPLTITPAPSQVIRVLVGRLEYLTPEAEADVEKALRALNAPERAARESAQKHIAELDRFLEPNLRRVLAHSKDETVLAIARDLLSKMSQQRK